MNEYFDSGRDFWNNAPLEINDNIIPNNAIKSNSFKGRLVSRDDDSDKSIIERMKKTRTMKADENLKFDWLIPECIIRGTMGMIYAPPGSGKSFASFYLCLYLLLNKKIKHVVYIDADNSIKTYTKRKIGVTIRKYRRENTFEYWHTGTKKFQEEFSNGMDFIDHILKSGKEFDRRYRDTVLIVDSFRNFIGAGDMLRDQDVIPILNKFQKLRDEKDMTIIYLHHSNKADDEDYKGASSFRDSPDFVYFLRSNNIKDVSLSFVFKNKKKRDAVESFQLDVDLTTKKPEITITQLGEIQDEE